VRFSSESLGNSNLVLIKLYKVAEEEEQKLIFTDRVKVKHGFIIIEHPPESGECLVVAAKGQWREKNRWLAHKGWKGKDRKKTTYDPARIRLEAEDSE